MSRIAVLSVTVLSMACMFAIARAQTPDKKKASAEGVVLKDSTNEPVRRAEVTLMLRREGSQSGMSQSAPTTTDAEGKFRFENLEPGTYILNCRKQGMMMPRRNVVATSGILQIAEGQEIKGLRCALQPQAVISGKVLDEDGEPVQGATVQALARRSFRGKPRYMSVSQGSPTNDRGEFRLIDLPPGKYVVSVAFWNNAPVAAQAQGQSAAGYVPSFYPGVADVSQASMVETAPGAEVNGIDVQLRKVPVFRVRGKVSGVNGEPLAQFYCNVVSRDSASSTSFGRMTGMQKDGSFEVAGIPSGAYNLLVQVINRSNPLERQMVAIPIDINGQDVEGINAFLKPGIVLQGTVSIQGANADKYKDTVASANVYITPADDMVMYMGAPPARPRDDGSFSLAVGSPGKYRLLAGVNSPDLYVAEIKAGGEDCLLKDLDLTQGSPGPVKIVLRADGGKVAGTVERNDQDQGNVLVALIDKDPAMRQSNTGRRMAPVNQMGGFELTAIRPGEYLVLAIQGGDPNAIDDAEWMKQAESKAEKVKVSAGAVSSVQLKAIPGPLEQ